MKENNGSVLINTLGRSKRKSSLEIILSNPVTFLESLTTIENQPTQLYQKQKEFLLDPARFRIVLKARQCGFSKCITGEALWAAIAQPEKKNEEIIFLSTTERQAKRLLNLHFYNWYDSIRLKNKPKLTTRSKQEAVFRNGSIVASLPNSPKAARGYTPTRVYLDEFAHFGNDIEIMTAVAPSLAHGGKLTIQSTPAGKTGLFFNIWDKAIHKKNKYSAHKVVWYDVPKRMIAYHEFVEEHRGILPVEYFRQEFECLILEKGRSPFPIGLLTPCINPESSNLKDSLDSARYTTLGMDLAKKTDNTVIVVCEHVPLEPPLRKKGDWYPYKRVVRHVSCPTYNLFKLQLDHLDDVIARYNPHKIYFDENNIGDKIGEELFEKYGRRSEGVIFTNKSKFNMIKDLTGLFENQKIEIPNDRILISQLNCLKRELLPSGRIRFKGEPDDYVWALALSACSQTAREPLVALASDDDFDIFGEEENEIEIDEEEEEYEYNEED